MLMQLSHDLFGAIGSVPKLPLQTPSSLSLAFKESEEILNLTVGKRTPCDSTPYFATRYAEDQREWRNQGRFMVYCASDMSKSGGFASYVKNALTAAFVVSILSERALLLTGDNRP